MSTLCYIDPASTALIWQILAGIFISLGVVFGIFWRKITTFFKSLWVKMFRKNKKNEAEKVTDEAMLELEDDEVSENNNEEVVEDNNVENNKETENQNK